jgi:predicted DNA-binding protein
MLTIPLTSELEQRLTALAARTGVAPDVALRTAVEQYVEDQEDIADALEALKTPGRRYTMDEIKKELDLVED